jgi:putative membrane protein
MSKIKVDKDKLKKISDVVKQAESKTSGEIATAIIKQSDNYAYNELLFSIISGFVYFMTIMIFSSQIERIIQSMFWEYRPEYFIGFMGLSIFIVIGAFYLLSNIPAIDRLIIPKKTRIEKVNQRALRYFTESGVYDTRDRTGILIFISTLEQRVELIADKGINEKIEQKEWNDIVGNIVTGLKHGNWVDKLSESITRCGTLLEKHFPIKDDDKNELKDELVVLEK